MKKMPYLNANGLRNVRLWQFILNHPKIRNAFN